MTTEKKFYVLTLENGERGDWSHVSATLRGLDDAIEDLDARGYHKVSRERFDERHGLRPKGFVRLYYCVETRASCYYGGQLKPRSRCVQRSAQNARRDAYRRDTRQLLLRGTVETSAKCVPSRNV